ncbi:hypothetical protein [Pectobacterium sp. IFB5596]|uniref:hypothetical protein n=1 Tax=Pectobacterium sp. IFB5596 TaxID=1839803 RepID=UPI001F2583AB|nr:hypothetical protein [Pectobacterium sp. IFB5596]MCE9733914.1 hypothetical protein [Pectobacterium sp. IFB5596]GKW13527.1 hypothetical protein PEC301899_38090 [Pectobacterium carotovorum subsp. carotovorum]
MAQVRNFEIFRPGTFTAMDGRAITFTESMLNEVAQTYNPALWSAPLTIGHPRDNQPHLGDTKVVYMRNRSLHVEAEFAEPLLEGIKSGSYKNRSASFYMPDSPGNPTPGRLYLRHIGFLGSVPPAVTGLSPLNFAASVQGSGCADFASTSTPVCFAGINDCDTSASFAVPQPDGSTKQAFMWRGKLLYLPEV